VRLKYLEINPLNENSQVSGRRDPPNWGLDRGRTSTPCRNWECIKETKGRVMKPCMIGTNSRQGCSAILGGSLKRPPHKTPHPQTTNHKTNKKPNKPQKNNTGSTKTQHTPQKTPEKKKRGNNKNKKHPKRQVFFITNPSPGPTLPASTPS